MLLAITGLQLYGMILIEDFKSPVRIRSMYYLRLAIIAAMAVIFLPCIKKGMPLTESIRRISELQCGDPLTNQVIEGSSRVVYFDYTLFGWFSISLWVIVAAFDNIETLWAKMRQDYNKRITGMPSNIAKIDDSMANFFHFIAVLSSIS